MALKCDVCKAWYLDERSDYNKELKDGGNCGRASKSLINPCKGMLRKVE